VATVKQAALIAKLAVRVGKLAPANVEDAQAAYLKFTPEEAKAAINGLNEQLGFNRDFSPATTSQRAFILDLETKLLGKWETTQDVKLSYSDADARIKYLRSIQSSKTHKTAAPIVDIFTRKAV